MGRGPLAWRFPFSCSGLLLMVVAGASGCGGGGGVAEDPPILLGQRASYSGPLALTLTVGSGRTELRGHLAWDRASGEAVFEPAGSDRRLRLQRGADGAAKARLEVGGAEVQLDVAGQRELFALAALLYQTPRDSAKVTGLEGGSDGYRVSEGDRSLEVHLGHAD